MMTAKQTRTRLIVETNSKLCNVISYKPNNSGTLIVTFHGSGATYSDNLSSLKPQPLASMDVVTEDRCSIHPSPLSERDFHTLHFTRAFRSGKREDQRQLTTAIKRKDAFAPVITELLANAYAGPPARLDKQTRAIKLASYDYQQFVPIHALFVAHKTRVFRVPTEYGHVDFSAHQYEVGELRLIVFLCFLHVPSTPFSYRNTAITHRPETLPKPELNEYIYGLDELGCLKYFRTTRDKMRDMYILKLEKAYASDVLTNPDCLKPAMCGYFKTPEMAGDDYERFLGQARAQGLIGVPTFRIGRR